MFEKGSKNWEHGNIYTRKDWKKTINCGDGDYRIRFGDNIKITSFKNNK